jgi:hypothetical protein
VGRWGYPVKAGLAATAAAAAAGAVVVGAAVVVVAASRQEPSRCTVPDAVPAPGRGRVALGESLRPAQVVTKPPLDPMVAEPQGSEGFDAKVGQIPAAFNTEAGTPAARQAALVTPLRSE